MADRSKPPKPKVPQGDKSRRLAEALRENLARRKAQKRAREGRDDGDRQG